MAIQGIRIRLESPLATPLESGTLFGSLCWMVRQQDGEQALENWLKELPGRPFVMSSGLPANHVPVPLVGPAITGHGAGADRGAARDTAERKKRKRRAWLPVAEFLRLRAKISRQALDGALDRTGEDPKTPTKHRTAHNTINRLTGTTPKSGGLYFTDEYWSEPGGPGSEWDVFIESGWPLDRLLDAFRLMGEHGYGRDASLGRGRFSAAPVASPNGLFEEAGANRRMSLSHGVLAEGMEEVRYKLKTVFGKLGSAWAVQGNPFKFPVTVLQPGATFGEGGRGRLYGALLTGCIQSGRKWFRTGGT